MEWKSACAVPSKLPKPTGQVGALIRVVGGRVLGFRVLYHQKWGFPKKGIVGVIYAYVGDVGIYRV